MKNRTLIQLEAKDEFINRHIGPSVSEQKEMLDSLSCNDLNSLINQVVPKSIRLKKPLLLSESVTEQQAFDELYKMAGKNKVYKSFIGQGYYASLCPKVIQRNVLQSPAWYTAYTPYQSEISQGRLEALFNFQTLICELTSLSVANASMLDEATAAAEAMTFCKRVSKTSAPRFFIDKDCFPQTIEVLHTRAESIGIELVVGDPITDLSSGLNSNSFFGVLLQYPGASGQVTDYRDLISNVHDKQCLVVMAADILSLVLLSSPGQIGADVVIGSTQRFGVPLGFGGPHAAYFATREKYIRSIPGRLVGLTKDCHGKPAFRLALQTREQHIRREKATSNICTAQVLLAVIAGMYAVYHGPKGLRRIADRVHLLTTMLADGLKQNGFTVVNTTWFDTLTIHTSINTLNIIKKAEAVEINLRKIDTNHLGVSIDETTTLNDITVLLGCFLGSNTQNYLPPESTLKEILPKELIRTDEIIPQQVFNDYHSETNMLRYLRKLSDQDIALDRSMIPLGSCTMKLNATVEMEPISWPEFANIHPYSPCNQVVGYHGLIEELEKMLCNITGYAAFSLQPNAGSQGEYAGLLAIRAYHISKGEEARNICLIPTSAHGTNPASAKMCGMEVVTVKCDGYGNVDIIDLREKAKKYQNSLSALMVTYPSTHGVFEEGIMEICEIIHSYGGQVYLDGANLNAMVGLCQPGEFGSDVSHLNLHKTFCIPHGGGGPGAGPIGVAAHLSEFLPKEILSVKKNTRKGAIVSASSWGSAGILPIPWMYIKMMGAKGLKHASEIAILNANYIATRLKGHYPILYTGAQNRVAHECIIDIRPFIEKGEVTIEDIVKRLIDYGFHAPTMSFPVAGTLMIEPTESESKAELDRFCETMISIKNEIDAASLDQTNIANNLLSNSPHTATMIACDDWDKPYTRQEAVFPKTVIGCNKYWPPVGRVDNIYGDKNLVCSYRKP